MAIKKEIECLARLSDLTGALSDILGFLLSEQIIKADVIKGIMASSDHPKLTQALLRSLQTENKIQLLEYEWNVLPVERIKIVIVTDRNSKEFSYNF